ncbi:GTPase domain-containing protein [Paenibacillus solisilvae]|uniref:GTPase domain-containing protein n=1 Tax=Paenibacillus solisilvae TaxID=2486751 RepID=A0ABW0VTW3_9BACL
MMLRKRRAALLSKAAAPRPTVLEQNLFRLRSELAQYRGGRLKIAVLGQPGAGKSALIDLITDRICVPRPVVGQQTDATDWSASLDAPLIHYCGDAAFVDAPGYDTLAHPVGAFLNGFPFQEFDRLLLVLKGKVHESDDRLWQRLKDRSLVQRTMVARSFAEGLSEAELADVREEFSERFDGRAVLFSNRTKTGIDQIKAFALHGLG